MHQPPVLQSVLTRFSDVPPSTRVLWAKSGEPSGHGLLAHMLDVAAVTEILLEFEPASTVRRIASMLGLAAEDAPRWISALVGLHDFGKAIPGFQNKWPEGRQHDEAAGLSFSPGSLRLTDHALATASLLGDYLYKCSLPVPWIDGVLQAVSAHHGYNFLTRERRMAFANDSPEWCEARDRLFEAYWRTLGPAGEPEAEDIPLAAVEWLAGLTSTADWIGSNPEWFPLSERDDSLGGHFLASKVLAGKALSRIGWAPFRPLSREPLETGRLLSRMVARSAPVDPRPLQSVGDALLRCAKGPSLLLVEAPMGEGKTELAFLAHLRLQAANDHRGLYVALPTKATGNAMFQRTLAFLQQFAGGHAVDIQLAHGGAAWNEEVHKLQEIFGSPGEAVTSSAWFSQRRRPLLSPYGVGTIDQALFATLNVKHHFVRLWGLTNRVIVLDEVHAYDWYTGGLIEELLRWLKPLGCSVILMSATLPRERRDSLLRAWDRSLRAPEQKAYPRILLADDQGLREESFASRPLPAVSLEAVDETLEAIAECVVGKLSGGGYGAVIVNTVDRAQQLYRRLSAMLDGDVDLLLFHARYPADQRTQRESAVMKRFGAENTGREGRALLIATQVAEQSLDIDFDFLITDLAPVDLVLQRAGRLHRHQRVRPHPHTEAVLTVAGLHSDKLPEMTATAWKFVYDEYILGRTWAFLSRERRLSMPEDIDRLVQTVYAGDQPVPSDIPPEVQASIEGAQGEFLAEKLVGRQTARDVAVKADDESQYAYEGRSRGYEEGETGTGRERRTRLDSESVVVVPVHFMEGSWALKPGEPGFAPDGLVDDVLARTLYARQMSLSHKGIVKHFQATETAQAFAAHPLLRHLKPLVLTDNQYVCEEGSGGSAGLSLILSDELGLVIQRG